MIRSTVAVLSVLASDARRHRWQTLTTVLGVAVGIAVIVAIRLASEAALTQFRGTFDAFTGKATHQLTADAPMRPVRLAELRRTPGVAAVQPVVTATLAVRVGAPDSDPDEPFPGPRTLRLVGVDPFSADPFLDLDPRAVQTAGDGRLFERLMIEPGLVAVSQATLDAWGLDAEEPFELLGPAGPVGVRAVALAEERLALRDPPFALTDLATAQEVLGLEGSIPRFDLILDGPAEAVALGPGERLERPEQRGERASSMTEAFRLNLLCLGFLAVLVGAFLAFNMSQFAVTRRRPLLGRLRCLGCPATTLRRAVLVEAMALGALGGLLGLALGRVLAGALVGDVARTVGTLYGPLGTEPVPRLDPLTVAGALVVAVGATAAACWSPARSAARTPPIAVAGQADRDPPPPPWLPLTLLGASGLLLLPDSAVVLPAAAVLSVLLAVATAAPRLLGRLVARPPHATVLALATGRIQRSLGRTGAAAGALVMPMAMTIAVLVMVGSFREEVSTWSDSVLAADVFVRPRHYELAPSTARLQADLPGRLLADPRVDSVDRLRLHDVLAQDGRSLPVAGAHLAMWRSRDSLRILRGGDHEALLARVEAGEVMVSEPLARRLDLDPGGQLTLPTPAGQRTYAVAGVFQDFSFDRGYALLAEPVYLEAFGETGLVSCAVILAEGQDPEAFASAWRDEMPLAEFRTVGRLRGEVLEAFDDTFAITYVLQSISTTLALVGILTALLCLHLERRHELGILRALGARSRKVGGLLLAEAGILMGLAGALAVPTGLVLAWILVAVVNTRSFGWSFPVVVDVTGVLGVVGLALGAGLLAGLVPWVLVGRSRVAPLLETRT